LIGINRILPKDGRKHEARFLEFYAKHGRALDETVPEKGSVKPFIKVFLLTDFYSHPKYCIFIQQCPHYHHNGVFLLTKYIRVNISVSALQLTGWDWLLLVVPVKWLHRGKEMFSESKRQIL